jgi:type IV secretory pathway protease TraF
MCKHVAGRPGDRIVSLRNRLWVCRDDAPCRGIGLALSADTRGLPLQPWEVDPYGYVLAEGEYWMAGPNPKSFDSRYVGPIPSYLMLKTIKPLWIKPST